MKNSALQRHTTRTVQQHRQYEIKGWIVDDSGFSDTSFGGFGPCYDTRHVVVAPTRDNTRPLR